MDDDLYAVLRAYPLIYLACHVEHRGRKTSATGLTSREASFLAHLEDAEPMRPAVLARHLGIAPSSLSAALARLEKLGMIAMEIDPADARGRLIRLTAKGKEAFASGSVLEPSRVAALLDSMDPDARRRAVDGLALLGAAARRLREEEGR
ncbi:MAG TPA: MarR family winged helix-turn-helix transcriptional regulator [Allosphingosinicella sp.]|jgi:DNA-binding MarR family transcriptional regulator|nr:MarR family winged helix-turn-helix transcriptional regulator [Allosphingosinicella sp.]